MIGQTDCMLKTSAVDGLRTPLQLRVYRSLDFKPGLGKLLILLDQVEVMFCSLLGNRLVREPAAVHSHIQPTTEKKTTHERLAVGASEDEEIHYV